MMTRNFFAIATAAMVCTLLATPALALDLNSFRAQHKLPPLAASSTLAGAAYSHARDLAQRRSLDHNGFRARMDGIASTAAENVLVGCDTADCAFRKWASSAGHRRNMLMKGVASYGLASATGDNGRKYWVLTLGN